MFARYLKLLRRADLTVCVLFALASTALWWALSNAPALFPLGGTGHSLVTWATGGVYSVLVLFRYVEGRWRLATVAGAGVFSYWLGIQIAATPAESYLVSTALAGVVTALFLGYVVARLGRLRLAWRLFAMLAGAGVLGGGVIGWSMRPGEGLLPLPGDDSIWFIVGHGLWQVLTCAALYLAPQDAAVRSAMGTD